MTAMRLLLDPMLLSMALTVLSVAAITVIMASAVVMADHDAQS